MKAKNLNGFPQGKKIRNKYYCRDDDYEYGYNMAIMEIGELEIPERKVSDKKIKMILLKYLKTTAYVQRPDGSVGTKLTNKKQMEELAKAICEGDIYET